MKVNKKGEKEKFHVQIMLLILRQLEVLSGFCKSKRKINEN
jgi:hypothetical protein